MPETSSPRMIHEPCRSSSNHTRPLPRCFVVMPFGRKRRKGGRGKGYDFDKVYRVLGKAVRLAGLEPFRADEQTGGIVHADMFRALREAPVVLADLTMDTPNVYYELGRRHGHREGGTVLVCRAGTELPFDVRCYRVHFYRYDGDCFDFDEAERFIEELRPALEEAAQGAADDPARALVERHRLRLH